MKLKKRLISIIACIILVALLLPATLACAKSLAASFSGGTSIIYSRSGGLLGDYWKKSCYAKTSGYSGRHYVRAYIGGSKSSPSGAWVDSGRCYSNGDIKKTVYTKELLVSFNDFPSTYFPTGYAKYGKG